VPRLSFVPFTGGKAAEEKSMSDGISFVVAQGNRPGFCSGGGNLLQPGRGDSKAGSGGEGRKGEKSESGWPEFNKRERESALSGALCLGMQSQGGRERKKGAQRNI